MNLVIGAAAAVAMIAVFVLAGIKVAVTTIAHPLLTAGVAAGLIVALVREGRVKTLADRIPFYSTITIAGCWIMILAACAVLARPSLAAIWSWVVGLIGVVS